MLRAAVFVILLLPLQAWAGAWTLERGRTKAFVTSSFTYGDHGFDADGNLITVSEYRKVTLRAALEYGIRPWLTGLLKGEVREETAEEASVRSASVLFDPITTTTTRPVSRTYGSAVGGARVRLYEAPRWVVSTEVLGASGGFTSTGTPAASDGPAVEARALVGVGDTLFGRPVFADAQAAYRVRFGEDHPDEVLLDLTLGARVLPRWLVLAQSFSTFELEGGDQFHKVSGSLVRTINDRLAVELSANTTVYGRDALKEVGGTLGFWWSF